MSPLNDEWSDGVERSGTPFAPTTGDIGFTTLNVRRDNRVASDDSDDVHRCKRDSRSAQPASEPSPAEYESVKRELNDWSCEKNP